MQTRTSSRSRDLGALLLGAIILFAGAWYFLRNTLGFEMDELNWEPIWPIIVIAIGLGVLYRALTRYEAHNAQK